MLKDILKLAGAKQLSKFDQKSMNGSGPIGPSTGGGCCNPANDCCTPSHCPKPQCPSWGNTSCTFLYSDGCCF